MDSVHNLTLSKPSPTWKHDTLDAKSEMSAADVNITRPGSAGQRPATNGITGSKLYQTIMTPINFITFLISLWIVSGRYQKKRTDMHPPSPSRHAIAARLPAWVHRVVFRPQPYQYIDEKKGNPPNASDERFYYHTKQRKIMRLEAADALELRSSVLMALCAAGVVLVWVCVCLIRMLVPFALAPWPRTWRV